MSPAVLLLGPLAAVLVCSPASAEPVLASTAPVARADVDVAGVMRLLDGACRCDSSAIGGVPVANAIAAAVEHRAARGLRPITSSPGEDAALLSLYAWHESRLRTSPTPWSWDARGGQSCGVWQEPCAIVRQASLESQAELWLDWAEARGVAALDSSPSRAAHRQEKARALLRETLAP